MSNSPDNQPFERDRLVDKPGILGARWWHAALADQDAQIARRAAIRNILIAGGVIAGFGAMIAMCAKVATSSSSPDVQDARKTSLDMQKEYGWSFGAVDEPLVFDGVTTKPFQPAALHSLATDLAPSTRTLTPFFQATLFQSPDAIPPSLGKLDPTEIAGFKPLSVSMQPIFTRRMEAAYARGKSLASLFASVSEQPGQTPATTKAALIVDLPGPEAVAFAAGASSVFEPVFLFDNWPHPRGVVHAQDTLSAAAYYQPLFAEARADRARANARLPMFVLDRSRIAAYRDDATEFDNRYVAKLPPSAAAMSALGASHVLYVVPLTADATKELDDVNDELVLYASGGVDVKSVSLDMFGQDTADAAVSTSSQPASSRKPNESDKLVEESGFVYYGGSRGSHHAFFVDYPWAKPARAATARPGTNPGKSFEPRARTTPYSSGNPSGALATKARPANFSTVPVVIALGTGIILGARYSRSGSWNRSSGGFGGG